MRCHKAKDYISRQLDEQLPPAATVKLTEHLDSCADCREYRADLLVGRRAMTATAPRLPDNFDWKLQLKLNRTLQRTAGEAVYPWTETGRDKWRWFRNFGAAAAMGMAAVLALAVFFGPTDMVPDGGRAASEGSTMSSVVRSAPGSAGDTDRLPLFVDQPVRRGLYGSGIQRPVSTGDFSGSGGRGLFDSRWPGHNTNDLRAIQRLQIQNGQLNRDLYLQQQMILRMRAQLDSTDTEALDLKQE